MHGKCDEGSFNEHMRMEKLHAYMTVDRYLFYNIPDVTIVLHAIWICITNDCYVAGNTERS